MKHWPRLHDSYIARAVVGSVLLAWGVLLGLDVVLAFAGDVKDIGKGGYTVNHAIAATGLSIPWRAYNLFPTAAVIGALMGLGQLAASSELAALRALPEAYRETLVLRLVEGLSGAEIAERTGLTPGSVRVNLHRGMALLRIALDGRREGGPK